MRDLSTDLPGAVERAEIHAVFQPQIDLESGQIVGAEALCRWNHPEWGNVPPDEFIPVAEESGAIHAIGRFMAEQCCRALSAWGTVDISVNVSPLQLATAEFTEWLAECLSSGPRSRARLTLEITESRPIVDVAAILLRLEPLRELGVGIALDDFGSGHASMAQLRRLHGTELKLDRSLVTDASEQAGKLMRRAIAGARRSGIRVVAEGIETAEHLVRMRDLGVDRAQGYLLGRPMSREALGLLLVG